MTNRRFFLEKVAAAPAIGSFSVTEEVRAQAQGLLSAWNEDEATKLIREMLHPEGFGWAVTFEVRNEAQMFA